MENKNGLIFNDKGLIIQERSKGACLCYCEIVSIREDRPYATILTVTGKRYNVLMSLQKIMEHLPSFFFRCSQSDIVNLLYIKEYESKGQTLLLHTLSNQEVSVSKLNRKSFYENYRMIGNSYSRCIGCLSCGCTSKAENNNAFCPDCTIKHTK